MLPTTQRFEKLLASLILLSSLGIFLRLAWPAFSGLIYTYDDLGLCHLPFRYFYSQALASGNNFLWSPSFYCGVYLHGEGQVGMYHPLHLLFYSLFPLNWAFNLEFLSSYVFLFGGTFWMLRRWALPKHAALMGSLIFTFGGFNLLHFMHMNGIAVVAHIPWLIAAADLLITTENRRETAFAQAIIALLTASQLLLGYPQYVLLSTMAEVSFVFWKSEKDRTRVIGWFWAKFLGGMMGMIQILPTWDTLLGSSRSSPSIDFRLKDSLHPLNFLQLWSPLSLKGHNYGNNAHEYGLYNGSLSTVALAWLFIRHKKTDAWRRLAKACAVFAGFMLLFALGRYGLVYSFIADWPVFNLFRVPARYIVLAQLGLSILAAITFAELAVISQKRERIPWKALWPLLVPVAFGIATILAVWQEGRAPSGGIYAGPLRAAAGTGLIALAALFAALAARGMKWSLVGLVLLTTIDVFVWGMDYVGSTPTQAIEAYVQSFPEPPDAQPGRLDFPHDPNWRWINVLTMKGYRLDGGYMGLEPTYALDPLSLNFQRLAGVRWTVENGNWKKIPDPMPRVRLDPTDGTATLQIDRPGWIDVAVSASSKQMLILSERYHRGWKAYIDGLPTTLQRADGDFMGCEVDSNSHHVEFRFQPESLVWGIRLALIGLCLLAYSTTWILFRKKPF